MSILKFKEDGVFKSVLAIKGEAGVGITSITKTGTQGKVDTYTILFTDGTTTTFTVTNGQDGTGTGDMTKAVYDTNDNGKVDEAEAVAWSGVTGKPSTFTPSSHTHTKSEVTDFAHTHTKSDVTDFSHTHTKSDVTDFPHTHTKSEVTDFTHTHTKSDVTDFAHTHTLADVSDVTATANEVNLLDGATSDNVRKITVSTTDIGVGASLPTGELYFVYE